MSIRVRGTLVIERKRSRRGDFNVGDLATEIGVFEVKDSIIEEFEPGKYTGDFMIRWIEPDSFSWRGRVFVKNRAQLDEILIDDAQEGAPSPAQPPEPDPIDTGRAEAVATAATPAATPAPVPTTESASVAPEAAAQPSTSDGVATIDGTTPDVPAVNPDQALFGEELFAQLSRGETLKLDPTVDRQQFRAQRDRLKGLGYGFDARSQAWSLARASHEAEAAVA